MGEVAFLKKLIKFQTYDNNENFHHEVSALYDFFESLTPKGYLCKRYEKLGYSSLLVLPQGVELKLLLQGHIDVVPGQSKQFIPQIQNGRLYGRGSSDMKFAAACYLKLLNDLNRPDLPFGVCLTSDEEVGGFNGVKYLLDSGLIDCEICFLPDGVNNWAIVEKEKGVLHGKLTAKGIAAHGSTPWLGISATEILIMALSELQNNDVFIKTNGKNNWHNTLNVGVIAGGVATNVVPALAEARIDMRFINKDAEKVIFESISQICGKYKLDFETLVLGQSFHIKRSNPYVVQYQNVLKQHGVKYKWENDHGASDGRFFSEHDIPVILSKPICGGDHTDEEWIDIKSLKTYYQTLKAFVLEVTE